MNIISPDGQQLEFGARLISHSSIHFIVFLDLHSYYNSNCTHLPVFKQLNMGIQYSVQWRSCSLCSFGLFGLLTMRSPFFTKAFRTEIFSPLKANYPEIKTLLQNSALIEDTLRKLVEQTNPLPHLSEKDRIDQLVNYHWPVYQYVNTLLKRHRTKDESKPLVIGISAPQGCGKTTLTNIVCDLFKQEGKKCIALSLDDVYLTGKEQEELAQKHEHNKLLEFRGNAGTHDLQLAMTTLHTLSALQPSQSGAPVAAAHIPRYDKSLREGKGDRMNREDWRAVSEPVDVVLFEGWMLGFQPLSEVLLPVYTNMTAQSVESLVVDAKDGGTAAATPGEEKQEFQEAYTKARDVKEVNELLRPYEALHWFMDAWLVLAVPGADASVVHRWRLQAEQAMRATGRGGLSDKQVAEFVGRFMPAYETYLPGLYAQGPQRANLRPELATPLGEVPTAEAAVNGDDKRSPVLKITVNMDRLPTKVEVM